MSYFPRRISAVSFAFFLAACGSGGEGTDQSTNLGGNGDTVLLPGPSNTYASLRSAPADNATLSGIARIEISGWHIRDVKLLPAQQNSPVYGGFNYIDQYEFESASTALDFDTTKLPNGALQVRIVATDPFNGNEVVVMSPRTWHISNAGTPAQFSASLSAAPANGARLSGIRRLEVRGTGLANVELLPSSGYTPKHGVFNVSADRTYAWLDFDTRSLSDGAHNLRISAFNVMAGQRGAQEIVVMPNRQWTVQNGTDPNFSARLLSGPVNGETVSGPIQLDVRGMGIENVELLPANGYSPKYGVFSVYAPENGAVLRFDPATLPPGVHEFRISAFNKPAGTPGAQEIVIMPARKWNIQY